MRKLLAALAVVLTLPTAAHCADWQPAPGPLMTRWAKEVSPQNAHPEYPRPQMVRQEWMNLNGLWDYAIVPKDHARPADFQGQILVPFPAESALSGVMKKVGGENRLWYRRTVSLPSDWQGQRFLLHFGAVDWESTVWVNGTEVGTHRGGYDPFTYDITEALRTSGEQEIVVAAWDPASDGTQPRGKQVNEPKGIWYTANTGIWQTVWLEPVPAASIAGLKMTPDVDRLGLEVAASGAAEGDMIEAVALDGGKQVAAAKAAPGKPLELKPAQPKLWTPEQPFLYDLRVTLLRNGKPVDEVESYFGLRKVSLGKDEQGITRIMLNGKFVFQMGTLDQGWWPDGLYTAATDEALRYDVEVLKKLGFNMLRKHVKVEPDRLYYWCDKLGLLVWQDMPSGDKGIGRDRQDLVRTPESARQFELELNRMIDYLKNHPSIVMWVPFNEGWGQFDTARIAELVKKQDPTRLVNNASGWADRGVGDVNDMHRYPGPGMPEPEADRAVVLGEFGGLGLPLARHTWQAEKNWGYRSYESREDLTGAYVMLIRALHPLVGRGLSAAVYTQTSDVEIEVNGVLTYDRALIKPDADKVAAAHARLKLPPPVLKTIMPTSEPSAQTWRYTTEKPAEDWMKPQFDDSSWREGPAGFGTQGTPGSVVRTEWKTPEIWLRRAFEFDGKLSEPELRIHHDEDAQVYVNGALVAELRGHTTSYGATPLDEKARSAFKPGRNVMAVHCRQTGGAQYIDVGLDHVVQSTERCRQDRAGRFVSSTSVREGLPPRITSAWPNADLVACLGISSWSLSSQFS